MDELQFTYGSVVDFKVSLVNTVAGVSTRFPVEDYSFSLYESTANGLLLVPDSAATIITAGGTWGDITHATHGIVQFIIPGSINKTSIAWRDLTCRIAMNKVSDGRYIEVTPEFKIKRV